MTETSYPVAGGGGVTDATYEQLMAPIASNGRVAFRPSANDLALPIIFADSTGRQFKVRANSAYLMRGFRWECSAAGLVRPLAANTSGNPRLDLVVLRLDRSTFTVRLEVLQGAPAATPTMPAVTQQTGTTGRFEMPLAAIRVNSNNSVGMPSIASSDVTPLETWLAAPPAMGHSSRRGAVQPGSIYMEYDTGRMYAGLASAWQLIGENGPSVRLASPGHWDTTRNGLYVTRRNGFVHFQGLHYRTANAPDVAANVDVLTVTLPEQFRPPAFMPPSLYVQGSTNGNVPVRARITRDDGQIIIIEHPLLRANHFVHFGPFSWPAR